jgi:Ser/Thr protein kinase RdoA (MazF antagonist)
MLPTHILPRFVLPARAHRVERLPGGHIHRSWQVELDDGSRWILQRINEQVFSDLSTLASNVERVVDHLQLRHAEPLWLQPTRSGPKHLRAAGTLWRMWPYLPGRSLDRAERPEQAEAAGRAFGRFARQVSSLPAHSWRPSLLRFHDLDERWAQLCHARQTALSSRLREARPALDHITQAEKRRQDLRPHLARLPVRLAHCDAKLGNVRLHPTQDQALAVLDFDTVMAGTPLYDLGDLIRSLSSPEPEDSPALDRVEVRPAYLHALWRGYTAEADLSPFEQSLVPEAGSHLILIMAIRFLSDYLAGDVYFPTKYPRHNLDRSYNQLALLQAWQSRVWRR